MSILGGAACAVLLTFPAAALTAITFRFPVPFAGYRSGLEALPLVLTAVVFYGLVGGFAVVGVLGALAGLAAYRLHQPNLQLVRRWTFYLSALAALLSVILLAVLDKLIGPW